MGLEFESQLTYENLNNAYQITIFAAWGLGVDVPRLLARYARSYPSVNNIHGISMMIIGLLTIMYVIAKTSLYYTKEDTQQDTQQDPTDTSLVGVALGQFVLEWILVGLIVVQFGLGFKVRTEMTDPEVSVDLFWLKRIHKYLGTFMSLLGKVIVILMLEPKSELQSTENLFRSWFFVLGSMLFFFVIFQIVYRIQTRKIMLKFPLKHNNKHERYLNQIFDNLNNGVEDFNDYQHLGVRYIILDNVMYYIDENFIHPGGEHIFTLYNGQQINYLFRGTHELMPDFPRHRHTKYAMNYLEERVVGELEVENLLLNFNSASQELVEWKIGRVEKMEGGAYMVQFDAKDGYVKQSLKVENFGKYMMISCPSEEIIGKAQRPYSIIVSLSEYQMRILDRLKDSYKYYYHGSSSSSMDKKSFSNRSDIERALNSSTLTFCIREYRDGLFTNFMLKSQAEKTFSLMGPFGRGLKLRPRSKGFFIIIGAGTGVLPFIDLFQFLLQKTLYRLIAAKAGDVSAKKLNEQRVDFSELQGVKVLFIGSFQSPQHFYLDNIIKDLYHLNRKHDLDQFDMMLRYNNMENEPDVRMIKETFDEQFISSLVKMEPNRIYYCGPSSIEYNIRKVQDQLGRAGKIAFHYI